VRFVLDSGRRVAVHLTNTRALWPGAEDEHLVVFCHGAPGTGLFDPDPAETAARNVTLLAVDRPGYGRSDPIQSGRWSTVGCAADDIAAVLDSLGVGRVGVVGWSAGGRVALALAARRPDLVERVVVAATPAPDEEVPWIDSEQRAELDRLRGLPPERAHAELARVLDCQLPADPFSEDALWLLAAGVADEPALGDPDARNRLGHMLRAAFAQGAAGLAADIAGYCLQPWGFEPAEVQAETLLLYGARDPLAGPEHGSWWEERLPDARLELAPRCGHLLLLPEWSRALAHLAPEREPMGVVADFPQRRAAEYEEFPAA
jgi:pimeloyl-ACP methyl ester carboxylesterase